VTTKYESADLLLKLYDLRREPLMRKSRAWFREQFTPASADEILTVYRGKTSAPYRMGRPTGTWRPPSCCTAPSTSRCSPT